MIHYTKTIRYGVMALALSLGTGIISSTYAQDKENETKPVTAKRVRESGRDPFRKYEPKLVVKRIPGQVAIPSIQERIMQYKAQKLAAMNARMVAPKPTTALLLNEIQVIGISRSPRGFAAIVHATPIKLTYVIYPGERLYDGQLVAIEETRLIFRRETVFLDGRRERSVEIKPLRQAESADLMSAAQTEPTSSATAESGKSTEQSTAPKP
jgi:hypothetical protein